MPHLQGCLIRSLKSRVDLNARSLIPSLRAEAPRPVRRANRPHLVLAALIAIGTFLTQGGAPCKSTIVLGGEQPAGGRKGKTSGNGYTNGTNTVTVTVYNPSIDGLLK